MPRRKAVQKPELPQPDDHQEPIWRYMDLAKFVDLLARRKLYLNRVDRFDDPFEAVLPTPNGKRRRNIEWYDRARRQVFASCWRLGREESEAMWKLYCGNTGGIAVVLPYATLAEWAHEHDCAIGVVQYIDYRTQSLIGRGGEDVLQASLHKRIAFAHEREVRVVRSLRATSRRRSPESPDGIDIDFDPEQLDARIVVSPLSAPYFESAVEKILEAFAPRLMRNFARSDLYERP